MLRTSLRWDPRLDSSRCSKVEPSAHAPPTEKTLSLPLWASITIHSILTHVNPLPRFCSLFPRLSVRNCSTSSILQTQSHTAWRCVYYCLLSVRADADVTRSPWCRKQWRSSNPSPSPTPSAASLAPMAKSSAEFLVSAKASLAAWPQCGVPSTRGLPVRFSTAA